MIRTGLPSPGMGSVRGVPLVGGEVVGVFEAISLAGQRRELHLHPGGGLVELTEAQDAGGIVRVGAAGALSGVEGERTSCASGMPSPSLSNSGVTSRAGAGSIALQSGRWITEFANSSGSHALAISSKSFTYCPIDPPSA